MNPKSLGFLSFFLLCYLIAYAQSNPFTGTYANMSGTIYLQFKPMGSEYHGLLQANGASFAMKATSQGNQMNGTIYGGANGPVNFTATSSSNGLLVNAFGYTENFYMMSRTHNLAYVDLTPYMKNNNHQSQGQGQGYQNSNTDYDYSYSQHSDGYASERLKTYPNGNASLQSPYPELNDRELFGLVAGTQVVIYNRTSILSSSNASSLTYINYCANGTFWINYDGSFSVEGYSGGNAQGATYGQNSGVWKLVRYQGQPAVYVAFNNGNTNVYPINKNLILQGRWRVGNTQYAVQRNKVRCQ